MSHQQVRDGAGIYLGGGFAVILLLFGGFGVWAAHTRIAGAVIAPATVVVETHVKKVQHLTGGIVGEIRVRNGDKVATGELLIRLDATIPRANLRIIDSELDELHLRQSRLLAERDGSSALAFPSALLGRESESTVGDLLASEKAMLASRRELRDGQKSELRERILQLEEEVRGVAGQITAKLREIALITEELGQLELLEAKQLIASSRMVALRREAARLEGEHGQLRAAAAQARGRITECELQILRIDQELRKEVAADLRETQARKAELLERRVAAEDQLQRIDIRAPQAGLVHQLAVHTVGGVVAPGETLMLIVPENERLVLEARVAPRDIDQVLGRSEALVRFAVFNQRTTPELRGTIASVSADLTRDAVTGEAHFVARIAVLDAELARLEGQRLVPGMPAEVQIRTVERTALSYLLKPLEDQIARAFKER